MVWCSDKCQMKRNSMRNVNSLERNSNPSKYPTAELPSLLILLNGSSFCIRWQDNRYRKVIYSKGLNAGNQDFFSLKFLCICKCFNSQFRKKTFCLTFRYMYSRTDRGRSWKFWRLTHETRREKRTEKCTFACVLHGALQIQIRTSYSACGTD